MIINELSVEQRADSLLVDWYDWQRSYRPAIGFDRTDPSCEGNRSSRQFDTTAEITREICHKIEMERVDYCVRCIPDYASAINNELRNRISGAKIWRSAIGKTYENALYAIIPLMRRENLL